MPRRAVLVLVLALVSALLTLFAAPAAAKGPTGATITGPGIEEPIVIEGSGERGVSGNFSAFVEAAGFWPLVGGVEALGPVVLLDGPPAADLGPMYLVAWHLGDDTVEAEVYPTADGGPVVHVAPDRIAEFYPSPGGWVVAPGSLPDLLAGYGVPVQDAAQAKAPPPSLAAQPAPAVVAEPKDPAGIPIVVVAAGITLLSVSVLWAVGRRPRRVEAP